MDDEDIIKYCGQATERGITHARQIHSSSIVTAPWVRLKCQFGCPLYGKNYCCPPYTPTPEQTRTIIDSYHRAILFHMEAPKTKDRGKRHREYLKMLTDLEGDMFKDGFYKAFVILSGPCRLCETCAKLQGAPCIFRDRARPSMEGCGIDVYQTARNNGFFIQPLRDKVQTQNNYCLMLVD